MTECIDLDLSYAPQVREIFNHAIAHTTALYDYEPRSLESVIAWWNAKRGSGYPIFGIVDPDDVTVLKGFATFGPFRERPANKYTIEHSLYVHPAHYGAGLGTRLLSELIERARRAGFHTLIGVIDSENLASIRLHQRAGFLRAGALAEAAFKFDRWLTMEFYQLILDGPAAPTDG